MKTLKTLLIMLVLAGASGASAEDDTFFLGDGKLGFDAVTDRRVVNRYARVREELDPKEDTITIGDIYPTDADFEFLPGQLVMVLQTAATGLTGVNGASVNLDSLASGRLGRWEFTRIKSIGASGGDVELRTEPLIHSYNEGLTQVIYVPEYASLYISPEGKIDAHPWDGRRGGVVTFFVRDTLINDGTISASSVGPTAGLGAGFRGAQIDTTGWDCGTPGKRPAFQGEGLNGDAYGDNGYGSDNVANGGGGGQCDYAGGGGGGGFGAGGVGGRNNLAFARGGEGGAGTTYTYPDIPWRLIMGGGGGGGYEGSSAGGTGGGAIFIRASSLFGTGTITANGLDGQDSTTGGGGGGGAGGTIILRVVNTMDCLAITATGGVGGDAKKSGSSHGPGGGGGGGRIFVQAPNASGCSISKFKANGGNQGESTSTDNLARGAAKGADGQVTALSEPLTAPGDVMISVPTVGGFVNNKSPIFTVQATTTVVTPANRKVYLRFSASPTTLVPLTYSGGVYSGSPTADLSDSLAHTVYAYAEYQRLRGPERSLAFKVDTTPPNTLPPTTKPDDPTNSSSARFILAADEPGVTFQCVIGTLAKPSDASFVSCNNDTTFNGLSPGTHTLWMRAVDVAGNFDKDPEPYTWKIDQDKPNTPVITAPASAFVTDDTPDIQGTRDSDAHVVVYIDDDIDGELVPINGSTGWSFTAPTLTPGLHSVRVLAKDRAGNTSSFSPTVLFTVDTMDPFVNFTYPGTGTPRIRDNPLVVWGLTEPGSTVTITLLSKNAAGGLTLVADAGGSASSLPAGSAGGTAGEWRYQVPDAVSAALLDGTYVVRAKARDASTRSSADVDREFILDRKTPETLLGCPSRRFTNENMVRFTLGAEGETAHSYDCVVEKGSSTTTVACSAGTVTLDRSSGAYGDGTYTLRARARDVAGNVDPFAAACSWTWDKTPPGAVDIDGPPAITDSKLAVFEFSATDFDNLSGPVEYECLLWNPKNPIDPASTFGTCSNPYSVTVAKGDHLLRVRSRDLAGNVSAGEWTYPWTVDTGLPVPVIIRVSGADNPTNASLATFRFELKGEIEDPSKIVYRYTDDPTVTTPSGFKTLDTPTLEITMRTEGEYSIQVLAQDTGRGLETPRELWESYTWKVDRTPPKIEIVDRPATWERLPTARFVFSAAGETTAQGFRCTISDCVSTGAERGNCTGDKDGSRASFQVTTGLQEGRNCIDVWAVDLAGNLSAAPASYEWNLDTQAPEPPVINTTQPGELKVATRIPSVEGTAEAFADVAVLLDNPSETNKPVWVSANEHGRWKALIAQEVSDGTHTLRTWARDRAGNEGPQSEAITLLVDSQSPAQVVGGGVGCTSAGNGGSLLALLGLARLLYRGRGRRRA